MFLPPKTSQSQEGNTNIKQRILGGRAEAIAGDVPEGGRMGRERRGSSWHLGDAGRETMCSSASPVFAGGTILAPSAPSAYPGCGEAASASVALKHFGFEAFLIVCLDVFKCVKLTFLGPRCGVSLAFRGTRSHPLLPRRGDKGGGNSRNPTASGTGGQGTSRSNSRGGWKEQPHGASCAKPRGSSPHAGLAAERGCCIPSIYFLF